MMMTAFGGSVSCDFLRGGEDTGLVGRATLGDLSLTLLLFDVGTLSGTTGDVRLTVWGCQTREVVLPVVVEGSFSLPSLARSCT